MVELPVTDFEILDEMGMIPEQLEAYQHWLRRNPKQVMVYFEDMPPDKQEEVRYLLNSTEDELEIIRVIYS